MSERPFTGFKVEHGYLFCDLCGCKPTSGTAGDEDEDGTVTSHQVEKERVECLPGGQTSPKVE